MLDPGRLNTDAGAVEVHRTSGEWLEHRHHEDPRYDRVVLHVVLLPDRHTGALRRHDGTVLPEVALYDRLADSLRRLLHRFYTHARPDFPCAEQWPTVPDALKRATIRSLGRVRLREHARGLAAGYLRRPDLDALLYRRVLRALGYAPNAEPMERLAERVPLERIRQLSDLRDVEAALLGVAGLLPHPHALLDADRASAGYVRSLRERYAALSRRGDPAPMAATAWQFFRLRPANFPTRRIAQAAALCAPGGLLHHDPLGLLLAALEAPRPHTALRRLLTGAEPSPFWRHHVRLDRACAPGRARIGRTRADGVLVNAVLPVLFLHAEQTDDPGLAAQVEAVYQRLPAPADAVTRRFASHGTEPRNAIEAQGLHHLYRTQCEAGGCLSCRIGKHVLRSE